MSSSPESIEESIENVFLCVEPIPSLSPVSFPTQRTQQSLEFQMDLNTLYPSANGAEPKYMVVVQFANRFSGLREYIAGYPNGFYNPDEQIQYFRSNGAGPVPYPPTSGPILRLFSTYFDLSYTGGPGNFPGLSLLLPLSGENSMVFPLNLYDARSSLNINLPDYYTQAASASSSTQIINRATMGSFQYPIQGTLMTGFFNRPIPNYAMAQQGTFVSQSIRGIQGVTENMIKHGSYLACPGAFEFANVETTGLSMSETTLVRVFYPSSFYSSQPSVDMFTNEFDPTAPGTGNVGVPFLWPQLTGGNLTGNYNIDFGLHFFPRNTGASYSLIMTFSFDFIGIRQTANGSIPIYPPAANSLGLDAWSINFTRVIQFEGNGLGFDYHFCEYIPNFGNFLESNPPILLSGSADCYLGKSDPMLLNYGGFARVSLSAAKAGGGYIPITDCLQTVGVQSVKVYENSKEPKYEDNTLSMTLIKNSYNPLTIRFNRLLEVLPNDQLQRVTQVFYGMNEWADDARTIIRCLKSKLPGMIGLASTYGMENGKSNLRILLETLLDYGKLANRVSHHYFAKEHKFSKYLVEAARKLTSPKAIKTVGKVVRAIKPLFEEGESFEASEVPGSYSSSSKFRAASSAGDISLNSHEQSDFKSAPSSVKKRGAGSGAARGLPTNTSHSIARNHYPFDDHKNSRGLKESFERLGSSGSFMRELCDIFPLFRSLCYLGDNEGLTRHALSAVPLMERCHNSNSDLFKLVDKLNKNGRLRFLIKKLESNGYDRLKTSSEITDSNVKEMMEMRRLFNVSDVMNHIINLNISDGWAGGTSTDVEHEAPSFDPDGFEVDEVSVGSVESMKFKAADRVSHGESRFKKSLITETEKISKSHKARECYDDHMRKNCGKRDYIPKAAHGRNFKSSSKASSVLINDEEEIGGGGGGGGGFRSDPFDLDDETGGDVLPVTSSIKPGESSESYLNTEHLRTIKSIIRSPGSERVFNNSSIDVAFNLFKTQTDQMPIPVIDPMSERGIVDKCYFLGTRPDLYRPCYDNYSGLTYGVAKFPMIDNDSDPKIFAVGLVSVGLSDQPFKFLSEVNAPQSFREFVTADETKVKISRNFAMEDADEVSKLVDIAALTKRNFKYMTVEFHLPGQGSTLSEHSFNLAFLAACMGIPCGIVWSGLVETDGKLEKVAEEDMKLMGFLEDDEEAFLCICSNLDFDEERSEFNVPVNDVDTVYQFSKVCRNVGPSNSYTTGNKTVCMLSNGDACASIIQFFGQSVLTVYDSSKLHNNHEFNKFMILSKQNFIYDNFSVQFKLLQNAVASTNIMKKAFGELKPFWNNDPGIRISSMHGMINNKTINKLLTMVGDLEIGAVKEALTQLQRTGSTEAVMQFRIYQLNEKSLRSLKSQVESLESLVAVSGDPALASYASSLLSRITELNQDIAFYEKFATFAPTLIFVSGDLEEKVKEFVLSAPVSRASMKPMPSKPLISKSAAGIDKKAIQEKRIQGSRLSALAAWKFIKNTNLTEKEIGDYADQFSVEAYPFDCDFRILGKTYSPTSKAGFNGFRTTIRFEKQFPSSDVGEECVLGQILKYGSKLPLDLMHNALSKVKMTGPDNPADTEEMEQIISSSFDIEKVLVSKDITISEGRGSLNAGVYIDGYTFDIFPKDWVKRAGKAPKVSFKKLATTPLDLGFAR